MAGTHSHDAQVHRHEHTHVTHYLRHGQQWEHEGASHDHEHNHAAMTHAHEPHEDPNQEHAREPTSTTTSSRPSRRREAIALSP